MYVQSSNKPITQKQYHVISLNIKGTMHFKYHLFNNINNLIVNNFIMTIWVFKL